MGPHLLAARRNRLFEAPDIEVLSDFQAVCGAPFTEATEVVEIPGDEAAPEPITARVAVTLSLADDDEDPAAALRALGRPEGAGGAVATFVRAYWDGAGRRATAVFAAHDISSIEHHLAEMAPARIVERAPEDYR